MNYPAAIREVSQKNLNLANLIFRADTWVRPYNLFVSE